MVGHPVLSSFVVALSIRVAFAVVSGLLHDGLLISDEGQYLLLAQMRAEGELTPQFWAGYGQALFGSTRTFMWPVTALFWIFGPFRILAQLVAALFGAFTAAAAASLAIRVLRPKFALVAGLVVALFPSQILFSSVGLRESLIWAGLATMAVVVIDSQRSISSGRIILSMTCVGFLFLGLLWLRPQTAICALWCACPALVFGRDHRFGRAALAVCVLAVLPWIAGLGIAGVDFGESALKRMGLSRGYMSVSADSRFGDELVPFVLPPSSLAASGTLPVVLPPSSLAASGTLPVRSAGEIARQPEPSQSHLLERQAAVMDQCVELVLHHDGPPTALPSEEGSRRGLGDGKPLLERKAGDWACIYIPAGAGSGISPGPILIDNRISTSILRIPFGLYDTLIRPLPWEESADRFRSLAGIETVLWLVLYGLAAYGTWMHRERCREIWFPVTLVALLALGGAVTHGNLGTSYRHRGQLLAMLAVLAVGGLQALIDGRRDTRAVAGPQ